MSDSDSIGVGDHVVDRDGDDDRMLVMARPDATAAYQFDDGTAIADTFPQYPDDDQVILVAYVTSTAQRLEKSDAYAFPEGALRCVSSLHPGAEGDDV